MKRLMVIGAAALLALPLAGAAQESAPAAGSRSSRAASYDIDLGELIARFAKRTGKQFIVDPRVRAQVPLEGMDPDRINYEKLLSILSVHQFAAVTQGDWIIVVPDANIRSEPTPVYTDRNFKALDEEMVTLIVKTKNVCAALLVPVLRPLMPQAAHLAAEVQTNSLIINDHAANARRIVEMIEVLDRGTGPARTCDQDPYSQKKPN